MENYTKLKEKGLVRIIKRDDKPFAVITTYDSFGEPTESEQILYVEELQTRKSRLQDMLEDIDTLLKDIDNII